MSLPIDKFPELTPCNYAAIRSQIRSGDILLASGSAVFSKLIQQATNSIWSHVAFILRLDAIDRIMVLESVESIGVRTVPLSSYLKDYNGTGQAYPGKLLIARHDSFAGVDITKLSQTAVDLLGYPYASEDIAKIAAKIEMGKFGIDNKQPLIQSDKAFICSEYVYTCYKSVGITIGYDQGGYIAPADYAKDQHINPVCMLN
ncbi:MAG: hypothetical protein K0R14_979 [Burkholderiales bacterium]|jgi:uncharacterized protein YycO|nr:hypothetical protein [Burkholderiales bacterium]